MLKLLRYIALPLLLLLVCINTSRASGTANYRADAVEQDYDKQTQIKKAALCAEAFYEEELTLSVPVCHKQSVQQSSVWPGWGQVSASNRVLLNGIAVKSYLHNTQLTLFYRSLLFPFHVFW